MISQLSVFIENEKGHLSRVCRTIADAGINMKALFLADTKDFGVARIFCDQPIFAEEVLKTAGYRARVVNVLGVRVPDTQGGLAELLEFLDSLDVNIEYGYCFSLGQGYALNALKISDEGVEAQLEKAGYVLATNEELTCA